MTPLFPVALILLIALAAMLVAWIAERWPTRDTRPIQTISSLPRAIGVPAAWRKKHPRR